MGQIPVDFQRMANAYPMRSSKEGQFGGKLKDPDLRKFMSSIPGTPCCVQVSHALNMAGMLVPQNYTGARRLNSRITINGTAYYYLLAVDEMERYLTQLYGSGELVSAGRNANEIKKYLRGRKGILVMRDPSPGIHTELWDGNSFLQKDMAVDHLLGLPRVLFWECTLAAAPWLDDYMSSQA